MPLNVETAIRSRLLKPAARLALAVMACAGLAGCGGGGSAPGGGDEVMVMPKSPDLVVSASVDVDRPIPGAPFTLSATVRNAGGGDAPAATLRFYRSTDAAIETSDKEEAGDVEVPGLGASENFDTEVALTAPSTLGIYYYGACVDAAEGESDTANNCSEPVEVTVTTPQPPAQEPQDPPSEAQPPAQQPQAPTAGRPDLVVEYPSVSPASPAAGGVFSLFVRLRNAGDRTAPVATVRFYRSEDARITPSDTQLVTVQEKNLKAREIIGKFGYGPLDTPLEYDTYYYGACVDAAPGETVTSNNCSAALTVEVTHDKPNLQVRSYGYGGWRGDSLSLNAWVRNVGGPSAATTLHFIVLPDRTSPPSSGEVARTVAVPELVKTERRKTPKFFSGWISVTPPQAPGQYCYLACVDPPKTATNVVDESDTTDNCSDVIRCVWR